jgi:hypothetical protein
MNARPIGVHFLAALAVATGIIAIAGGLALLSVASVGFLSPGAGVDGTVLTLLGITDVMLGVASLFVAFGSWYTKSWAWSLGLAVYSLVLVAGAVGFVLGASSLGLTIVTVAAAVLVLYLLFRAPVREAFGRPRPG